MSSEQKSASQLPTCLLSKPFVISVLVELVFGVLCFKVFVFVCLSFVLRGWVYVPQYGPSPKNQHKDKKHIHSENLYLELASWTQFR